MDRQNHLATKGKEKLSALVFRLEPLHEFNEAYGLPSITPHNLPPFSTFHHTSRFYTLR